MFSGKITKLLTHGEIAPPFELSLVDGSKVCLNNFLGRPIILTFVRHLG